MSFGWFKKKECKPAGPRAPQSTNTAAQGSASKTIKISRLLRDDLIVGAPAGVGKEQLIEFLVKRLCESFSVHEFEPYLTKVLEREQGISTTLDTGLAVPHARMDGLDRIAVILGLVPEGMPDPKQPDLVIRAMFLFFSPNRQEAFTQHLHLLRGVSSLFQPEFIDEVLRDPSGPAVMRLIQGKESAD
ncbi:MAG: PTS sugar transporter subunit IIA [Elusimicrobiota bacterium]